jgi:hypothetical protein
VKEGKKGQTKQTRQSRKVMSPPALKPLRPSSLPPSLPPPHPSLLYPIGAKAVDLAIGEDGYELLQGRQLELHELREPDPLVVSVHNYVKLSAARGERQGSSGLSGISVSQVCCLSSLPSLVPSLVPSFPPFSPAEYSPGSTRGLLGC